MTVGIPKVTAYGASYGTPKGNRIIDYESPLDEKKQNRDAGDLVEWKPFERTVKDFVLARLGYPTVDVELNDFQLETCIDEAITTLEYYAPDWMTQYAAFDTSANVEVYQLPQVITDNLTDVFYRDDFFRLGASPGSLEYDFAIMFFTNTGLFNNYNISQYLLFQQYLKQIKNVLGQMSTWQLVNNKFLHLWPIPEGTEGVILEYRAVDPDTIHPHFKSWIQRFSLAIAKGILGEARGKYESLPGPGGGARLNGASLVEASIREREALMVELTESIEQPPMFDIF